MIFEIPRPLRCAGEANVNQATLKLLLNILFFFENVNMKLGKPMCARAGNFPDRVLLHFSPQCGFVQPLKRTAAKLIFSFYLSIFYFEYRCGNKSRKGI